MRLKYQLVASILVVFCVLKCGAPSEPKEYIHTQADFKITAPAGWRKTFEDHEMFEFRSGDYKLVEVGGFDIGVPSHELYDISNEEFLELLIASTMEGLDGYCIEAQMRDYTIEDEGRTVWGDRLAYHVTARGYSRMAEMDMKVDLVAIVYEEKSRMYFFASQIAENEYADAFFDIASMIASFQIIE